MRLALWAEEQVTGMPPWLHSGPDDHELPPVEPVAPVAAATADTRPPPRDEAKMTRRPMRPLRTTRGTVHRIVGSQRTAQLWCRTAKQVERCRMAGGGGLDDTGAPGNADATEHWRALRVRLGALADLFAELRLGVTFADACAALGAADRDELSRALAHRRLPPFRLLKNWCQVVAMAQQAAGGTSLCDLALRRSEYPAAWYRLLRSTTGHPWTVVESRGLV